MARNIGIKKMVAEKMPAKTGGIVNAMNDARTCGDCAGRHGSHSDQSPPFHPNCRCTIG